jgi:hypothetical protein
MKHLIFIIMLSLSVIVGGLNSAMGQSRPVSAGVSFGSAEGSVSQSIGLVGYTTFDSAGGTVHAGVQHPAGCTDAGACNYDPSAVVDDGSCDFDCNTPCLGDFNSNGQIDFGDLSFLLSEFGCTGSCIADLNNDNIVNFSDLSIFLSLYGSLCP